MRRHLPATGLTTHTRNPSLDAYAGEYRRGRRDVADDGVVASSRQRPRDTHAESRRPSKNVVDNSTPEAPRSRSLVVAVVVAAVKVNHPNKGSLRGLAGSIVMEIALQVGL